MIEYPTDEELDLIESWDYNDFKGLMLVIEDLWSYPDYFSVEVGKSFINKKVLKYDISTGGWSGNEDIIAAMMDNTMFWSLCWEESRRGGHYKFEVKNE